jgi:uncharacterized membrane protein (DUF4010 family)
VQILEQLGLAVLLGALVGLERQKDQPRLAGLRTFPLITAAGTLFGHLSLALGGVVIAVGVLALAIFTVVGNVLAVKKGDPGSGITTEVAILLMFAVGANLAVGSAVVSIVMGGAVAVLLQFKPELHKFAERLNDSDVRAIMRLVLIAAIILPLLPDKQIGAFEVLNPHNIWRMVVLVVGINLTGYLLYRFFGTKDGTLLSGLFGGIISSTATTLNESKRTAKNPKHAKPSAVVILIACFVMYVRVIVWIALIAPTFLKLSAVPLGIMLAASLVPCLAAWFLARKQMDQPIPVAERPEGLKGALVFAALYALIGVGIALANRYLGSEYLLWVAGISGLTDVDAITLSTSKLVKAGELGTEIAWKMILVASLANNVFKVGIVAATGSRALLAEIALLSLVPIVTGVLVMVLG